MSGGSMGDKWRGAQEERNEGKLQLLCKINGKNAFYKKIFKKFKNYALSCTWIYHNLDKK